MAVIDDELTRSRPATGGLFPYNDPRSKPGLYQTAGFGAAAPGASAALASPPRPPAPPPPRKVGTMSTPDGLWPYNDPRGQKSLYGAQALTQAALDPGAKKKGFASDAVNALKQGSLQLPGAATGLADIPAAALGFNRPFSKAADSLGAATGFKPGQWAKDAEADYSPATQAGKAEIDAVWEDPNTGALDVAKAYATNPRVTALNAIQSVPAMTTPSGVFPYNDQRGSKSLYSDVTMPTVPAGFMPGVRAVMAGVGEDAATAAKAGNYGVAAGHVLRGLATMPVALAHDITDTPAQMLEGAVKPVVGGIASAANTFATGSKDPVRFDGLPAAAPRGSAAAVEAPTLGAVNPQTDVQRGGAKSAPMVEPTPVPGLPNAPGGIYRNGNSFGDSPESAAAMLARPAGMSAQNQAAFDTIGDRANAESVARVQAAGNKATYDQQVAEANAINERETRLNGSKEAVAALNAMQANQQNQARLGMDAQRVAQEGQRVAIQSAQAQLAAGREARDAARGAIDLRSAQRLDALQSTILDPKSTPEAKQSASAALLLASPDEYQIVHAAGGQTTDPNTGLPVKQPDRLVRFSKRTGQYEEIGAAPTGQMPAVPADKAALVKGTTYQTARGPATWDGKQFVPATGK